MLTTAVDGNPCKAINIACKILVNAAHAAVPGATLTGMVDVAIVSDREKTVGALLGEGLVLRLKLGVGDEVDEAAVEIEGMAVAVAARAAAATTKAFAS